MITIENDNFKAEIDEHGAQLTHLINKEENFDYIWNGEQWKKHAPVLFPAIGRSNQDKYVLDGKTYEMPQHGFVSDQNFNVNTKTENMVALELVANEETKQLYPFDFKLTVTFNLLSTGLALSFAVENNSDQQMPFSLGSHPAFNLPINGIGKFENYEIEFTGINEPLRAYEIVKTPAPYRTGKEESLTETGDGKLKLNHTLFKPGLRIISNPGVKKVRLSSPTTEHEVELDVSQFANVCLWTMEDQDVPFLCIEPFNGLPDVLGDPVDWMNKEGNLILQPHANKLMQYEMHLS